MKVEPESPPKMDNRQVNAFTISYDDLRFAKLTFLRFVEYFYGFLVGR